MIVRNEFTVQSMRLNTSSYYILELKIFGGESSAVQPHST